MAKATPAKKKATKKATGPTLIQRSRAVSPGTKAYFHHVSGAGRSRVKRKFFGLSEEERLRVTQLVSLRIGRNLADIRLKFTKV